MSKRDLAALAFEAGFIKGAAYARDIGDVGAPIGAMFDAWYEGRQKAKLALRIEDVNRRMSIEHTAMEAARPVAKRAPTNNAGLAGCASLQFSDEYEGDGDES